MLSGFKKYAQNRRAKIVYMIISLVEAQKKYEREAQNLKRIMCLKGAVHALTAMMNLWIELKDWLIVGITTT